MNLKLKKVESILLGVLTIFSVFLLIELLFYIERVYIRNSFEKGAFVLISSSITSFEVLFEILFFLYSNRDLLANLLV